LPPSFPTSNTGDAVDASNNETDSRVIPSRNTERSAAIDHECSNSQASQAIARIIKHQYDAERLSRISRGVGFPTKARLSDRIAKPALIPISPETSRRLRALVPVSDGFVAKLKYFPPPVSQDSWTDFNYDNLRRGSANSLNLHPVFI